MGIVVFFWIFLALIEFLLQPMAAAEAGAFKTLIFIYLITCLLLLR